MISLISTGYKKKTLLTLNKDIIPMNGTLKDKASQLIHCIRLAKALGYEDVEYTSKGYSLMKYSRVVKPFRTIEEAEQWLEHSFELNAKYDTSHFGGRKQDKISGYKELPSRMNDYNQPNIFSLSGKYPDIDRTNYNKLVKRITGISY